MYAFRILVQIDMLLLNNLLYVILYVCY